MYAQLVNNLDELGFTDVEPYLSEYLSKAAKEDKSLQDALLEISTRELNLRNHRAAQIQVSISHFPYIKTIEEFDYHFQPSVNKAEIKDLASLRFIDQKENILSFGTPGTGKTHLATAIGIEAAQKRNITYFITCHDLIQTLRKAYDENRLEARLKHFAKYKLLIIDEIGYLPVDKTGANLLFQLIAKRYEHNSTIITTNQPFSKWADVFSDAMLANAMLDRLLHHSHVIKMVGPSYRTKDYYDLLDAEDQKLGQ